MSAYSWETYNHGALAVALRQADGDVTRECQEHPQ